MSDIVDDAAVQIALNEARSIAYAKLQASQPLPTSENCLWCNSRTKDNRRWCNAECRDMWQDFGGQ